MLATQHPKNPAFHPLKPHRIGMPWLGSRDIPAAHAPADAVTVSISSTNDPALLDAILSVHTTPAPKPGLSDADALATMVDVLVETLGRGEGVLPEDFKRKGVTDEQMTRMGDLANATALSQMAGTTTRPNHDRNRRLAIARRVIGMLLPDKRVIVAALQNNNLSKTDIDDLLQDAMVLAADDFHDMAVL